VVVCVCSPFTVTTANKVLYGRVNIFYKKHLKSVPNGSGNLKNKSFFIRPSAATTVNRTVFDKDIVLIKRKCSQWW
jgi:hypothetical protein